MTLRSVDCAACSCDLGTHRLARQDGTQWFASSSVMTHCRMAKIRPRELPVPGPHRIVSLGGVAHGHDPNVVSTARSRLVGVTMADPIVVARMVPIGLFFLSSLFQAS
jgi:hypothetical protein